MDIFPAGTWIVIVATVLLTLLSKRVANFVLNRLLKAPILYLAKVVYRRIAPSYPYLVSLRVYRRCILRSNLSRIENPVGPNLHVPLNQAYAPLSLLTGDDEEPVDLFNHTKESNRFIVLGGPGTGKTTLMKSLLTNIVKGTTPSELHGLVPVFVELRDLAKNEQSVIEAVIESFENHHFPRADSFVEATLSQGKLLIILDGLDEVGASREFVSEKIIEFCNHDTQRGKQNHIIVTCREHSYRQEDLRGVIPDVVKVEPFANFHMRIFLRAWPEYKGRSALELYGLIQSDSLIRDICRNPLMLTILTGLFLLEDQFQLPTSRDKFYSSAIDELLIKRPARRSTKQVVDPRIKRRILERACLERLESTSRTEDPEKLSFESIERIALEEIQGEFNIDKLIKELIELNGILRPTGEGSYTCAHRTIQEYLAANEARRIRKTDEVISSFDKRPELIEFVYFYCGLVHNVPQLNEILRSLIDSGRILEAGKCVLYNPEAPDEKILQEICKYLQDSIQRSDRSGIALETLSSLAQRTTSEFKFVGRMLDKSIEALVQKLAIGDASSLESALATSPKAAMKVVPALLQSKSLRWKQVAVGLLVSISTDESLDMLVKLLMSKDSETRTVAAFSVTSLIGTNTDLLMARKELLTDRLDSKVWPFEKQFPGRIAIPIVQAIRDHPESSTNMAIDLARFSLASDYSSCSVEETKILKLWKNVPYILKTNYVMSRVARIWDFSFITLAVILLLVYGSAGVHCFNKNQAIVLHVYEMVAYSIPIDKIEGVQRAAQAIVSELKSHYPPDASGISRALPWNWVTEPVLPSEAEIPYEYLSSIQFNQGWRSLNWERDDSVLNGLDRFVNQDMVIDFFSETESLAASFKPKIDDEFVIIITGESAVSIVFPLTFLLMIIMSRLLPRVLAERKQARRSLENDIDNGARLLVDFWKFTEHTRGILHVFFVLVPLFIMISINNPSATIVFMSVGFVVVVVGISAFLKVGFYRSILRPLIKSLSSPISSDTTASFFTGKTQKLPR